MSETLFIKLLPVIYLALVGIGAAIFRLLRSMTTIKFYLRKICEAQLPKIEYGKDLE